MHDRLCISQSHQPAGLLYARKVPKPKSKEGGEQQIKKVPDNMVEDADRCQQVLTLATAANQGFLQGH
jgi:hypothetical protein